MAETGNPADLNEAPGRLGWQATPLGLAIICTILYFGAITLLWNFFNRDTFHIFFDGYVRSENETVRRRNHAKFRQTAPADANDRLLAILEDPSSATAERLAAVELIGESGASRMFSALLNLERTATDNRIRSAAIIALGIVPGLAAREELALLLGSASPEDRLSAIEAVRIHRRQDLAEPLRERIRTGDRHERLAAVAAASATNGMEPDLLKAYLSDPEPAVRLAAAISMREIPRASLAQSLGPALLDSSWVPVQPDLPKRRQDYIQRQFDASFLSMIEDALAQLQEGDPDLGCTGEECNQERIFYRDLLRRRSKVEMAISGFQRGKRSLYFVSGVWSSGTTPRFAELAMVLPSEPQDTLFPIRTVTLGQLGSSSGLAGPGNPASLGQVLSVTGHLKDDSIRVEILETSGSVTAYSFRNGVFRVVPANAVETAAPAADGPPETFQAK